MNLINFCKNEKLELKNIESSEGIFRQIGDCSNIYIFKTIDNRQMIFKEKYISNWKISKNDNGIFKDYFEFNGLGKIDDKYIIFTNFKTYDFNKIVDPNGKIYQIINVSIKNGKILQNEFTNEQKSIKIMEKINRLKNYNNIENYHFENTSIIQFNDFIDRYIKNKTYYFLINDKQKLILPFKITSNILKNETDYSAKCIIKYKKKSYEVSINMFNTLDSFGDSDMISFIDDVEDDGYICSDGYIFDTAITIDLSKYDDTLYLNKKKDCINGANFCCILEIFR